MLKKNKNRKKIFFLGLLVCGLILVRLFETKLFYDPFLQFFRTEYENKQLPVVDGFRLFLHLLYRFSLNSTLSLGVIYLVFEEKKWVIFSTWLFLFFFIILTVVFFGLLFFNVKPDYWLLFSVRRFLIQPVFLLLFLPAFYFQKINKQI